MFLLTIQFILAVISNTPVYVWALLAFLLYRGITAKKDAEVSLKKMILIPGIFIIWGIEKIINGFSHVTIGFSIYFLFLLIGSYFGYYLYRKYRPVYIHNNTFYRKGSYLSLFILLTNFFVKYTLNVFMAISPTSVQHLSFVLIYCMTCGLSVGLFAGGIYQTYQSVSPTIPSN